MIDFKAKREAAAIRKSKREEKRASLGPKFQKKAKRKKLPSMAKVRQDCWNVLSLYVMARDAAKNDGLCLICSNNPITLAYHLIPAGSGSAAKWNPLNVVGGCGPCNYGEYRQRTKYTFKHIELFGFEVMAALDVQSRQTVQLKRHDFLAMTSDFAARLATLKGEAQGSQ